MGRVKAWPINFFYVVPGQRLKNTIVQTWVLRYNLGMKGKTMYTEEQIQEFADFCARHEFRFNTLDEYAAAIDQYFLED